MHRGCFRSNNPGFTACHSTDRGVTWSVEGSVPYKSPTPDYNPAEAEIVELFPSLERTDGGAEAARIRLLVDFRYDGSMSGAESCGAGVGHCRWFAFSDDVSAAAGGGAVAPALLL